MYKDSRVDVGVIFKNTNIEVMVTCAGRICYNIKNMLCQVSTYLSKTPLMLIRVKNATKKAQDVNTVGNINAKWCTYSRCEKKLLKRMACLLKHGRH